MIKVRATTPVTNSYRAERDNRIERVIRHSVIFTWQTDEEDKARPQEFPLLIDGTTYHYRLVEE